MPTRRTRRRSKEGDVAYKLPSCTAVAGPSLSLVRFVWRVVRHDPYGEAERL
jgi:hypothetical protein